MIPVCVLTPRLAYIFSVATWCVQVARLLALLAVQPKGRPQVEAPQWRSWLSEASKDADCRLASHATRALLNLAAFRCAWARNSRTRAPTRPAKHVFACINRTSLDNCIVCYCMRRPRARSGFSPHSHADSVAPVYLDQVSFVNMGLRQSVVAMHRIHEYSRS